MFSRPFIAALLLGTLSTYASAGTLDSIPDVADKKPSCSLGRHVFSSAAAAFAKEAGKPIPVTYEQGFEVLAQRVLEKCDDGQTLTVGDQLGDPEFQGRGRKLMRKFCDESSITVEKMTYVDARQWPNARVWSCPISKLTEVRRLLSEQKQ